MKILLIEPPFSRFMGFYRYFFPFSLSSLSAFLKNLGHKVLIYDADHSEKPVAITSSDLLNVFHKYLDGIKNLEHPIWKEMEQSIKDYVPDLIGISFMSTKIGAVKNIIDISKKINPRIPVVLGGAHPSVLYQSSLEQTQADFVVLGEGEETFAELIQAIENGYTHIEKVNGLAFKTSNGQIKTTLPRSLINDLDSLPYPDREGLHDLETYRPDDLSMIMTSRGCPFNCTFCSSIWERRTRYRSIPHVIGEIQYLIDRFHAKNVYFKDDTFTINRKRIMEFCNSLTGKNVNVNWECLTRIEFIDEELIRRMREAGMFNLKIGIETGSQRLLTKTGKNITLDQIREGASVLRKLNQRWSAFFMLGYPDESEEEIQMTQNLIDETSPSYVSMSILAPYPGCQDYYELEEKGIISEKSNWNLYDPFSLYANVNQVIDKKRFRELTVEIMRFVDEYNLQSAKKSPTISAISEEV